MDHPAVEASADKAAGGTAGAPGPSRGGDGAAGARPEGDGAPGSSSGDHSRVSESAPAAADGTRGEDFIVRRRVLKDPRRVWDHNAWDDWEWTPEIEQEAKDKIAADHGEPIEEERWQELEREAAGKWDAFYATHAGRFFKERHYLQFECKTIDAAAEKPADARTTFFEVGCGNGSNVFPLLRMHPGFFVHACDYAPTAVQLVRENRLYDPERTNAFCCDISEAPPAAAEVPPGSVDHATVVFVLSAIPPEKMRAALAHIRSTLRPGGTLFFRDYGRYDLAQLRFSAGHKIKDNLYFRGDGTLAYFFTMDEVLELFEAAGFRKVTLEHDRRLLVNRKRRIKMYRTWLQGIFEVPSE